MDLRDQFVGLSCDNRAGAYPLFSLSGPRPLQTLYGHYAKTFQQWQKGNFVYPVLHRGLQQHQHRSWSTPRPFRNFDGHGNLGEGLDDKFPPDASDEIKRFRREIVERRGQLAEELQACQFIQLYTC
jgi:hypothetical protein